MISLFLLSRLVIKDVDQLLFIFYGNKDKKIN